MLAGKRGYTQATLSVHLVHARHSFGTYVMRLFWTAVYNNKNVGRGLLMEPVSCLRTAMPTSGLVFLPLLSQHLFNLYTCLQVWIRYMNDFGHFAACGYRLLDRGHWNRICRCPRIYDLKAFVCTQTMGMSVSLYVDFTNSLIMEEKNDNSSCKQNTLNAIPYHSPLTFEFHNVNTEFNGQRCSDIISYMPMYIIYCNL